MTAAVIKNIIAKREGINIEFKSASFELPKNIFETVCGMLNRHGGHLLLGITDEGTITGVIEDCIQGMKDVLS